jgi:hypothetical protein
MVFGAKSGEHYYLDKSYRLDTNGQAIVTVKAVLVQVIKGNRIDGVHPVDTAGALRPAVIDGVTIIAAAVSRRAAPLVSLQLLSLSIRILER